MNLMMECYKKTLFLSPTMGKRLPAVYAWIGNKSDTHRSTAFLDGQARPAHVPGDVAVVRDDDEPES
jgi:hypothetical protein